MSAPGVITLGLTRNPSEVLLFGFTSAAVVQGGGLVTLGLGLTPSRVLLHGLSPQVDSEWDLAAPMDLPALAGTLTLAGDLTYSAGEQSLEQSGAVALSGTLSLAGDLGWTTPLAQSGTLAMSGTLSLAGDLTYSDAILNPPAPPFTGIASGGGMSNAPRKHQATIDAEEWEEAERLRIQREDEMVLDCITALVAAGVL